MVHFTVECKALESKRDYNLIDRYIEDPRQRMIELLFRQGDYQGVGRMIRTLWFTRKAIIKYKEEEERNRKNRKSTPTGISSSDPGPVRNCQTLIRCRSRGNSATRG